MNTRAERIHALLWGDRAPQIAIAPRRVAQPRSVQRAPADIGARARALPHEIVPTGNPGFHDGTPAEAMRWHRFLSLFGIRTGSGMKIVPGSEMRRWYEAYSSLLADSDDAYLRRADAARLTEPAARCGHGWIVIRDGSSWTTDDVDEVAAFALARDGVTRVVPIPAVTS